MPLISKNLNHIWLVLDQDVKQPTGHSLTGSFYTDYIFLETYFHVLTLFYIWSYHFFPLIFWPNNPIIDVEKSTEVLL